MLRLHQVAARWRLSAKEEAMSYPELFTQLAYQFGPFFFAVLFTLFVTRTARAWYVSNTSHPLDETEKATFRQWFLVCAYFSIALVIISIGWYAYYNWGRYHALEGIFVGLRPNQIIAPDADQFFIKETNAKDPSGDIRDYYFVLVRDRPWQKGEKLSFKYWDVPVKSSGGGTQGAPPEPLEVDTQLVETDSFPARFVLRFEKGKPVIEQRR
jgi:hypothetical protein